MKDWRNEQGDLHRVDGPAVEWADGSSSWWLHGKRHRIDGPARVFSDGCCEWWLNGVQVDELTVWLLAGAKTVV